MENPGQNVQLDLDGIMEPVVYRLGVACTRQDWRDIAFMCHGAGLAISKYDFELSDKYHAIGKRAGKKEGEF